MNSLRSKRMNWSPPFLSHMIHAIRTTTAYFGKSLLLRLEKIEGYIREDEIRSLCSEFVNEQHSLREEEFVIVLDDYHLVEHSQAIEI